VEDKVLQRFGYVDEQRRKRILLKYATSPHCFRLWWTFVWPGTCYGMIWFVYINYFLLLANQRDYGVSHSHEKSFNPNLHGLLYVRCLHAAIMSQFLQKMEK